MINFSNIPGVSYLSKGFSQIAIPISAGVGARKAADYITSFAQKRFIPAYICIPYTTMLNEKSVVCFEDYAGKPLPFCADRINWIQPMRDFIQELAVQNSDTLELFNISNLLGIENDHLNIILKATVEEVVFRKVIQKLVLRELPRKIINKISPKHANIVDHKAAKAMQIAISAILFGLMHTNQWKCHKGGAIPAIFAGAIFGLVAETSSVAGASLAHIVANYLI